MRLFDLQTDYFVEKSFIYSKYVTNLPLYNFDTILKC